MNRRLLKMMFLLFPFVRLRTYAEIPTIGIIYEFWSLFSCAVIFFLYAHHMKSLLRETFFKWVVLFLLAYAIPTFIYPQPVRTSLEAFFSFFAIALYISVEIRRNPKLLLLSLSLIYGSFIYGNFILDIIFPNGLYRVSKSTYHSAHLLGDDNALIYVMLPGLICMACYSWYVYGKIKLFVWLAMFLCAATLLYVWAASAMVCVVLWLCFVAFRKVLQRYVSPYSMAIVVAVSIVVCLVGLNIPQVQYFITDVLHKDVTLSGRTILWSYAFYMIGLHPVIGVGGYFANGQFQLTPTLSYPCHTPYLQMLIDGGVVLFSIYVALTFGAYKSCNQQGRSPISFFLYCGLSLMLINYITEYSKHFHYFIIVALMYNVQYLVQCKKDI